MNKDKINKIIDNDRELESIMADAMHKVGNERDTRLIDEMAALDEEQFRSMLVQSKTKLQHPPLYRRIIAAPYFRAIAACIVCVLMVGGSGLLHFNQTTTSGYASMFKRYYTEYTATTFDAKGDSLNIYGKKNTAQLIQDASVLLSKRSRQSTRRAITILEWLEHNEKRRNTSLDSEMRWYLGLAYLKNNQKDSAKKQFELVKNLGKTHAKEADSLLKELNGRQRVTNPSHK